MASLTDVPRGFNFASQEATEMLFPPAKQPEPPYPTSPEFFFGRFDCRQFRGTFHPSALLVGADKVSREALFALIDLNLDALESFWV